MNPLTYISNTHEILQTLTHILKSFLKYMCDKPTQLCGTTVCGIACVSHLVLTFSPCLDSLRSKAQYRAIYGDILNVTVENTSNIIENLKCRLIKYNRFTL